MLHRDQTSKIRRDEVFDLSALMVGRTPPALNDTRWRIFQVGQTPQDGEAAFFISDSVIYFGIWDDGQDCFLVARSKWMRGSAWIPLAH